MLRCVSLRVLAGSCSLSPPFGGGRPRAPARCAAVRRGRGLSRCFGRCGGLAFRSAGGRCPPRRCPAVAPPRVLPLGLLRFAPAAVALVLRARGFAPAPFAVSGRRFGRCGRCAACSLPCSRGAPPPSAASPFVRVGAARFSPAPLVPASLRPRGLRRVVSAPRRPSPVAAVRLRLGSPPPCQRAAAAACGGRAAAGGLLAAAAAAAFCGALRPPARGLGFAPLRRRFFRGCCGALLRRVARLPCLRLRLPSRAAVARRPPRSGFARAARPPCLRLRLPSHAVGRATAARPDCAFGAFVVQGENRMQGATASTTYCADYSLDIPHTGEFGKTRIILPNYLWISSIDTAPHFWYAHIRN